MRATAEGEGRSEISQEDGERGDSRTVRGSRRKLKLQGLLVMLEVLEQRSGAVLPVDDGLHREPPGLRSVRRRDRREPRSGKDMSCLFLRSTSPNPHSVE